MYSEGGLSRGGREIGALAASFVNKCIYCAAVHANRYIQIEKRPEVVGEIYEKGLDADLPEFEQALFNFGVDMTAHPDDVELGAFRRCGGLQQPQRQTRRGHRRWSLRNG